MAIRRDSLAPFSCSPRFRGLASGIAGHRETAMKIYTRGGDQGETSLFGGERVRKSDPRIDAYGTVDELNSVIGMARVLWAHSPLDRQLLHVQSDLFDLGAHLASPNETRRAFGVKLERIAELEHEIDAMEVELTPLRSFILPGGSAAAAQLHVARTVCRRAERLVVALGDQTSAAATNLAYLNRLSDYLFVAARFANLKQGVGDVTWAAS